MTIKVTNDGTGTLSASQVIAITVNDINEPPDITSTGTWQTAPSFEEIQFDVLEADLADAD